MGMKVDTDDLISISAANKQGISKLVSDAEGGRTPIILRNNHPTAAVVGMAQYNELIDAKEDLLLLLTAAIREATDSGRRHRLDDVIAELGIDMSDDDDEDTED